MDFIELFDAVVRETKPILQDYQKPTTLDAELGKLGLDSLDYALIFMLLGEIYGLPDELADNPPDIKTLADVEAFFEAHAIRTFDTVTAAMEAVK